MFAIVDIAGTQTKVAPNQILDVPLMKGEPGDSVEFSNIYLFENDNNTQVGTPTIEGKVTAKIVEHFRDAKVIVFKKKRRKGYRKLNGHRQSYTKIEITNIEIN